MLLPLASLRAEISIDERDIEIDWLIGSQLGRNPESVGFASASVRDREPFMREFW